MSLRSTASERAADGAAPPAATPVLRTALSAGACSSAGSRLAACRGRLHGSSVEWSHLCAMVHTWPCPCSSPCRLPSSSRSIPFWLRAREPPGRAPQREGRSSARPQSEYLFMFKLREIEKTGRFHATRGGGVAISLSTPRWALDGRRDCRKPIEQLHRPAVASRQTAAVAHIAAQHGLDGAFCVLSWSLDWQCPAMAFELSLICE